MKLVLTTLICSILAVGCSSNDDDTSVELDDPNGSGTGKINADNYADLIMAVEKVGFHTFTANYNLNALTEPFTAYTNELFAAAEDTSPLNDVRDCAIGGSTTTTGGIYSGTLDYDIQYVFDQCTTEAGTLSGSAEYGAVLINLASIENEFELEFTDVDIDGERGQRIIQGEFDIEDNQQLSRTVDFDVTLYKVEVPDSMLLEVSGNGAYTANTSVDTQDPEGFTVDSKLVADLVLTTATGNGDDRLTVDVKSDLGLASTSDYQVGPPIVGSIRLTADDNSSVVISPADISGMMNVELGNVDGSVTQDTRSWSDFISAE